jgi:CDP-diacylglycerol--glycerol-3-phosphate 3-phosphatidyltransferase
MLGAGFFWLRSWWGLEYALHWLVLASGVWVYLIWRFWLALEQNHPPGGERLLPTLGIANSLSIWRGFLMAFLAGFLFSPQPPGWGAWVPGLLYTFASLPDYLDGYLARVSGQVTRLGETLDLTVDSLGVLVSTLLAAQYGRVPAWFILTGLARYLFLGGLWLRERLGKPMYELPYSSRRRGFAALQVGFTFVILYPAFSPPGTHIAAACFGIPTLVSFTWDWLIASGAIPPDSGARFPELKEISLRWIPMGLRLAAVVLTIFSLTNSTGSTASRPLYLTSLFALVLVMLTLGVLGRSAALAGLIALGVQQNLAPLSALQFILIPIYTALLYLGSGALSLWPLEDRWVYRRAGEQEL